MKKDYDYLDEVISHNLKSMIEAPLPIDIEEKWQEFELRLREEQKAERAKRVKKFLKTAVTVTVASVICLFTLFPSQVTAFKNTIFNFLEKSNEENAVINEIRTANTEPGVYKDINIDQARNLLSFAVRVPQYIPAILQIEPEITVHVSAYPKSSITFTYKKEDTYIIIDQNYVNSNENIVMYIPKNNEVENILLDNISYTKIKNGNSIQYSWLDSSIKYTILSRNITDEELVKIIDGLH